MSEQGLGALSGSRPTDGAQSSLVSTKGFDPARIEERLTELLALEENWNSYRARRVSPAAADLARCYANWLGAMGCTPWICPLSDGGLNIERAGKDDYAVEVSPNGRISLMFDEVAAGHAESILQHAYDIGALKRTDAIAMEARQGRDGATRLDPKDDSAGAKHIAQNTVKGSSQ